MGGTQLTTMSRACSDTTRSTDKQLARPAGPAVGWSGARMRLAESQGHRRLNALLSLARAAEVRTGTPPRWKLCDNTGNASWRMSARQGNTGASIGAGEGALDQHNSGRRVLCRRGHWLWNLLSRDAISARLVCVGLVQRDLGRLLRGRDLVHLAAL